MQNKQNELINVNLCPEHLLTRKLNDKGVLNGAVFLYYFLIECFTMICITTPFVRVDKRIHDKINPIMYLGNRMYRMHIKNRKRFHLLFSYYFYSIMEAWNMEYFIALYHYDYFSYILMAYSTMKSNGPNSNWSCEIYSIPNRFLNFILFRNLYARQMLTIMSFQWWMRRKLIKNLF